MNKKIKTILIVLLGVILLGGGIFVGLNWNNWFGNGKDDTKTTAQVDENAEDYTGDRDVYQGEKNTDTIDIAPPTKKIKKLNEKMECKKRFIMLRMARRKKSEEKISYGNDERRIDCRYGTSGTRRG